MTPDSIGYTVGSTLRADNGDIYTISPSYSDRKCIPPTVDLARDKLYREMVLGVNTTYICELELTTADYATDCNQEYFTNIGIINFMTNSKKIL